MDDDALSFLLPFRTANAPAASRSPLLVLSQRLCVLSPFHRRLSLLQPTALPLHLPSVNMDHAQHQILPDHPSAALAASAGSVQCQGPAHDAARVQPTKGRENSRLSSKTSDCDSITSAHKKSNPPSDGGNEHSRNRNRSKTRPGKRHGSASKVNDQGIASAANPASGPVLVRAHPNAGRQGTGRTSNMKSRRNADPIREPKGLPSLESFTFQDIFSSLDPEVKKSVDSIAEIYGRHKMSLADQHANHLPPHVHSETATQQSSATELPENSVFHRLEPVREAGPHGKRNQCLSLAGTNHHAQPELSSNPMAATSTAVTYRTLPSPISTSRNAPMHEAMSTEEVHSSSLTHIASWLRHLNTRQSDVALSNDTDTHSSATRSLRRILGDG